MKQIQILIVDDHPLMRDALRGAIEDEEDLKIAGEARNGQEAIEKFRSLRPDLIIMDLFMPGMDGLSAMAAIRVIDADARILALTSSTDESKVLAAIQAGALGFLLKDAERTELLQAIREVGRGNSYLTGVSANKLVQSLRQNKSNAETPAEPLTDRESEILTMIGRGLTNREISLQLVISEGTVRTHFHHILQKLSLPNRSQAILYIVEQEKKGKQSGS